MKKIGIRELKNKATSILRGVREKEEAYLVTHHGRPIAVLRPFTDQDAQTLEKQQIEKDLAGLKAMSAEISENWISDKTAVELVEEQRR